MKRVLSAFWPKAPLLYAYMLQQYEYSPAKFIAWAVTLPNLFTVQKRGRLTLTRRAKLMVMIAYASWLGAIAISILLALHHTAFVLFVLAAPSASVFSLYLVTWLLQTLVVNPAQRREVSAATKKLERMSAQRIAVLGSYGKTSMKELLLTVLSEGKQVAATPGNKNIRISHARWVNQDVVGNEDVLIVEYGEAAPGDIANFADFSKPSIAVVTGIAPAHLDAYPSIQAVVNDFADISKFVTADRTYVHDQSLLHEAIQGHYYDSQGLDGYQVKKVQIDFSGTSFELHTKKGILKLKTGLVGEHHVGPLAVVVAIARELGLSDQQIIAGVAKTTAYEHRMQPRHLHGAWIIDDTYNGNIEGMRAGLKLLVTLPGKKKIYVTPGLVDQGAEAKTVHNELGELIASANPNKVVLMSNSNTAHIQAGLETGGYTGEVVVESNPLEYYTNLEHFLAAGDVVMLQNDLPDSYK